MTGRFLQRDPIGITGGVNTYQYAGAQPTLGLDPSGLDRCIVGSRGIGEHWAIAVDDGNGGYVQVDFACAGWIAGQGSGGCLGGPGITRLSFPRSLGMVAKRITSTPAQDRELAKWMADKLLSPPSYSIRSYNCQHFAVEGAKVGMPPRWPLWLLVGLPGGFLPFLPL
jgi:hypothetical protein